MASRPQIDSLIQAYLDEELSPSEKVIFERELSRDSALRRKVDSAREVAAQLFLSLKTNALREDLTPQIMAHLPEMEGGKHARQEFAREATWRAKHPRSRARWFFTAVPAFAPVILAILAFAIFQAWPLKDAPKRSVVGMVTSLDGTAALHDSFAASSRNASLMSVLNEGDTFATGPEGQALLALSGPTFIKAREDSRIKLLGARAVQLEKGSVWLNVAKHSERFRVRTSLGDITVFGTTFSVDTRDNRVVVTLEEGEVTVENGRDFVVLRANEQALMHPNQDGIEKRAVDAPQLHAWANAIQPEPMAHQEFKAAMLPLEEGVLRGEQVWWVDTHNRGGVRAIAFAWHPTPASGAMSYDVLVYNENMQPLFTRRLDAALFANDATQQVELQLPEGKQLGVSTTFIRMVPDTSSGSEEVLFKEVSLIGATPPEGQ